MGVRERRIRISVTSIQGLTIFLSKCERLEITVVQVYMSLLHFESSAETCVQIPAFVVKLLSQTFHLLVLHVNLFADNHSTDGHCTELFVFVVQEA